MLGENGGYGIGMLAGSPQPDADGLVLVPSDLLCCTYTASTHDHEQCLCSFGGRGMQAIHRGADCFPKEEAAASTFVSSSAFAAAIAKNAGVLASRIGTSGDRWFFHAIQPSSFPLYHFHQESLPENVCPPYSCYNLATFFSRQSYRNTKMNLGQIFYRETHKYQIKDEKRGKITIDKEGIYVFFRGLSSSWSHHDIAPLDLVPDFE